MQQEITTPVPTVPTAHQTAGVHGRSDVSTIFVAGLSDYSQSLYDALPGASEIEIIPLLAMEELRGVDKLPITDLVELARRRVHHHHRPASGLVTLLDFPAMEIVALLGREMGLRTPSLESVLACTHKYWSRELQRDVAPECVPDFTAFDPFAVHGIDDLDIALPVWCKPLNAFCSYLGFGVHSEADLTAGVQAMREKLARLADPLAYFMQRAQLPEHIVARGAHIGIAEGYIQGEQCTLEGFVHGGEPCIYACIDSVREPNGSTFSRYQYPSQLPQAVIERMSNVTCRIMRHIGFDDGCFNAEFFWERDRDRLWLVEINPRLSQSHCELLEKVDGVSHQQIAIDIALGRSPEIIHNQGHSKVAAKFFLRSFRAGEVTRVPSAADLARIEELVRGATIEITVAPGMQLAEMHDQDAYSFELAHAWIGAEDTPALLAHWDTIRSHLPFEIDGRPLA